MDNGEYERVRQRYFELRQQSQIPASDLEKAAQELMDAFLLKLRPELWRIFFGNNGLAYVLVGIGNDNQVSYLGPYDAIEEMRNAYASQKDRFIHKREVQIGSLVEKGIIAVYDWLASLFRRGAITR